MKGLLCQVKEIESYSEGLFLGNNFWFLAGSVTISLREPLEMCEEGVYHKNWEIVQALCEWATDVKYLVFRSITF